MEKSHQCQVLKEKNMDKKSEPALVYKTKGYTNMSVAVYPLSEFKFNENI